MISAVLSTGLVPIHRAEPVQASTAEKAAVAAPTVTPELGPEDLPGPTSRLLLTTL